MGENDYGVKLYEVWGVTPESRSRLYDLIVVDYPKEMPQGYDIRENVRFAGYFLKLQGYEPAGARPGQRPEKAPLLIGRLEWASPAAPPAERVGAVALGWCCSPVGGGPGRPGRIGDLVRLPPAARPEGPAGAP